jgi:hypothetical protein
VVAIETAGKSIGKPTFSGSHSVSSNARLIANEPPIEMFDNVRDGVYREVIRGWERRFCSSEGCRFEMRDPLPPQSARPAQFCSPAVLLTLI